MNGRRGFALVAALICVVLLGALIVGAFLATTEDTRVTASVTLGARTLNAAESGVESAMTEWVNGQLDSVSVGGRRSLSANAGEVTVVTTLIRLDSTIYWVVGEATAGGNLQSGVAPVRRRIGTLVRRVADSAGRWSVLRLEERSWSELF